ncbi:unnamed protein product [Rodentolepis nana]|uniref:Uncharacterized protein n=1 Tax=Rodentolepis nana TaxID=102285 RepID=A0A0R3TIM6_RODNA|nr:unnamed protein product [Rodentolepis nana]
MEVSDAISGKANLETPVMGSSLTTPTIVETSTMTTTSSCSGKRSIITPTANTTDGEGDIQEYGTADFLCRVISKDVFLSRYVP